MSSLVRRSHVARRRWRWPSRGTCTSSATGPPTCPPPAAGSRAPPGSPGSPGGQKETGGYIRGPNNHQHFTGGRPHALILNVECASISWAVTKIMHSFYFQIFPNPLVVAPTAPRLPCKWPCSKALPHLLNAIKSLRSLF